MKNRMINLACGLTVASAVLAGSYAAAADKQPQVPRCDKRYGTVSVKEPETKWWRELQLESPESLIKVFVAESGCFTLVDRGKGLEAAQAERELAATGDLRGGSNVGRGQMRAADYVLVPDIVNRNERSGGRNIGGLLGGVVGGTVGAVVGGVNLKSKTAEVVLTLTDVRSTEQISLQQGKAKKTDLGWSGGAGGFFGAFAAAGASSYANTEIGQVVTAAYLEAFVKMVDDVKALQPDAAASNVQQAVAMARSGKLLSGPNNSSAALRDLEAGAMLYPTGEKQGPFWKVMDDLGNEGWVPMGLLEVAR
jgi:hypothetical protein